MVDPPAYASWATPKHMVISLARFPGRFRLYHWESRLAKRAELMNTCLARFKWLFNTTPVREARVVVALTGVPPS